MSAVLTAPLPLPTLSGALSAPPPALQPGAVPVPTSALGSLTEGLAQVLGSLAAGGQQAMAQMPVIPQSYSQPVQQAASSPFTAMQVAPPPVASPPHYAPVGASLPPPRALVPSAPSSLTEDLAQAMASLPVPAPAPVVAPMESPPTMTVEQLIASLNPAAGHTGGTSEAGLDTLRLQLFGRYYDELEGRMNELRQVLDGGIARARRAMLDRVDELGAALHRDRVALRQEVQQELEELKRDVFTTVMSLSAINDKIGLADSRNRETWMAVTKALTDRIEQQSKATETAINAFRSGADEALESRVSGLVENLLMKMAAARRSGAAAASPATATAPSQSEFPEASHSRVPGLSAVAAAT